VQNVACRGELEMDAVYFGDQLWAKVALIERSGSLLYQIVYAILNLQLGDHSYLTDNIPVNIARWVMKARAEIIDLNYKL
jgi:hypothetical protein